jgi:hypothetical protein
MTDESSRVSTSRRKRLILWSVLIALVAGCAALVGTGLSRLTASDSQVTPVTASERAKRVQTVTVTPTPGVPTTPGPAPTPGPPTIPSGPPGCGLPAAAFCDDFEGGRNTTGNRNGDLSTANYSLARWKSQLDQEPNHVDPGSIPACRAGASSTPLPPGDSLICDPSGAIGSHYALVSTSEQNYGDNSYRLSQQFDIAGRTGTIRFETTPVTESGLLGWPTLAFTSEPYNAPSYLDDNSSGPTPREGIQIHFNAVCPSSAGFTAFPRVRTYTHFQETFVHDENGFENGCPSAVLTQAGHLNRIEVHLSQSYIEIYASDASGDGVNFGPLKKMYSAPISLTFTRGYVYFGVHNHATDKYNGTPSWSTPFDNIAFDGPKLAADRVSQVDTAAQPNGGGMNLGWSLPNSVTGGATAPLTLPNVARSGATSGRLVFDMAADPISNGSSTWASWLVNYRFNGGAWHSVGFSADEVVLMARPRAGSYIFSVPIDLGEIGDGNNTVQFSGINFFAGYQPYIGNVDLVLS